MNSGVVRLDQIMSILYQASLAVFIAVFCFTHAEHNLIKLKFIIIDQHKLLTVFRSGVCYMKFKETTIFAHF